MRCRFAGPLDARPPGTVRACLRLPRSTSLSLPTILSTSFFWDTNVRRCQFASPLDDLKFEVDVRLPLTRVF